LDLLWDSDFHFDKALKSCSHFLNGGRGFWLARSHMESASLKSL
jgi:hypothetical protein